MFLVDIITRSVVENGYLLRFFFFVDCFSLLIVLISIFVTDVSFYVVLSFLKIIMIVRVTNIVVSYRKWSRSKLVERALKKRREKEDRSNKRQDKRNRRAQKYNDTVRTVNIPSQNSNKNVTQTKERNNTDGLSAREVPVYGISRQKSFGVPGDDNFEEEFKKQTKLESHVTVLTIKRTMT